MAVRPPNLNPCVTTLDRCGITDRYADRSRQYVLISHLPDGQVEMTIGAERREPHCHYTRLFSRQEALQLAALLAADHLAM